MLLFCYIYSGNFYQSHSKALFLLQGKENQMVDPRVIHVMLAEEEVSLSYYKSNYTL